MKPSILFLTLNAFVISLNANAAAPIVPPEKIDRESNAQWLAQIGASTSPYADWTFNWLEANLKSPLPPEVNTDPDKLHIVVASALAEAIKVEKAGDVEEGSTFGLETFAIVDAPIATVLETVLYRWGKPIGKESGMTHPNDTVFGFREEKISVEWGPGSYKNITSRSKGGLANPMNDVYSLLVRGNATDGYTIIGNFIEPSGETKTVAYITIYMIRPMADGKTDYRVAGMLAGQHYSPPFELDSGRKGYGFNPVRIRAGQKDFLGMVKSLKETGTIPEKAR